MTLHHVIRLHENKKISTRAAGKQMQLRKIENIVEEFQKLHLLKIGTILVKLHHFC